MLQTIESINSVVNNFIWGVPAMICIIGVGLYPEPADGLYSGPQIPICDQDNVGKNF